MAFDYNYRIIVVIALNLITSARIIVKCIHRINSWTLNYEYIQASLFCKLFIRVWRFSSADFPPPPSSFTLLGLIRCQHIHLISI